MTADCNQNIFTNYHLYLSKDEYRALKNKNAYPQTPGFEVVHIKKPDYALFLSLIRRVGGPWGWTRRPRYCLANMREIATLLQKPQTCLYLLQKDVQTVGYALISEGKQDFSPLFPAQKNLAAKKQKIIEIENFGLFPEFTGKKFGRTFLPALFDILFAEYDVVYLSSRSTNHARVIPFYTNLGMRILRQEQLENDLLDADILPANDPKTPILRVITSTSA